MAIDLSSQASMYQGIREHIGHDIEIVAYGSDGQDPWNVAIECTTCGVVLLDANPYEDQLDEAHIDLGDPDAPVWCDWHHTYHYDPCDMSGEARSQLNELRSTSRERGE